MVLGSDSILSQPFFGSREDKCIIPKSINEASGIAASKIHSDMYWLHNDSGDEPQIFLVDTLCSLRAVVRLADIQNRDWEDIAVGNGPNEYRSYIYIGEIGDNNAVYSEKSIIRIEEPKISPTKTDTILTQFDILRYTYPDGNRDAETVLLDPLTKDIYIVSKREDNVHVYRFSYPQSVSETTTLQKIAVLPFTGIVGGDISPNGMEILLKSYANMYYWKRNSGETIEQTFNRQSTSVSYELEPQGEAVCWTSSGNGYITVSEESPLKIPPHLYFYPRRIMSNIEEPKIDKYNNVFIHYNHNSKVVFHIMCTAGESVHAEIYDVSGKRIHTLLHDTSYTDMVECEWDNTHYGVYFCRVIVNNSIFIYPFYVTQ
jgi:hypothetical protein